MIFHENCLLADDPHEISYLSKMLQNLLSAAVVIGALRVNGEMAPIQIVPAMLKWYIIFLSFRSQFIVVGMVLDSLWLILVLWRSVRLMEVSGIMLTVSIIGFENQLRMGGYEV